MTLEDFKSAAYMEGRRSGEASRAEWHLKMDDHPNPYEYGSKDWQLWNLGWNHELMQNG